MKKVVRTISVDEEVYEKAAEICRNELQISVSDAINQLLIGLNEGSFHVSGKEIAECSGIRPRALKRNEILKILVDIFAKRNFKIEKCIYNRKTFYKVFDENKKLVFVFFLAIRDMENTSFVYRISEGIVEMLFHFANEQEKLLNMKKGEIRPMLLSYVVTPGNIFTWSFVDLKSEEFLVPQKAKESFYPVYRVAGKNEKDEAEGIGDFLFRVKTYRDMNYATKITQKSLSMFPGICEDIDTGLRKNIINSAYLET